MPLKQYIKYILQRVGLLGTTRSIIYWATKFDTKTTHPRRLMYRFYSQFIKKGDLCFDIGANVGSKTGVFLELGAKVICVEPQKDCIDKLRRSFGRNENVTIIAKGVASNEGVLDLFLCKEASAFSTMSKRFRADSVFAKECGYRWTEGERVSVTTLDLLISQYGMPAFCKIDVEGFEETALKGLTKPLPLLSFEFNAGFFEDIKRCVDQLLSVGDYKFNFMIAETTSVKGMELPEWVCPDTLYKELNVLIEKYPRLWGDIYAKV